MSKAPKFPSILHVTFEHPDHDKPYPVVLTGGVFDVQASGEVVAIYKLVEVGTVAVSKRFIGKKAR